MVTTTQDRPGEVCHIMGFNPVHKPVMVTTHLKADRIEGEYACFNPVHKPVMVTTFMETPSETKDLIEFQSRSQTGHGYNLQGGHCAKDMLHYLSIPFTNRSWLQPALYQIAKGNPLYKLSIPFTNRSWLQRKMR